MAKNFMIPMTEGQRVVHIDHGQVWTTSVVIAAEFGRRHDNVLQSLDSLLKKGTLNLLDLKEIEYQDERNRSHRAYWLNERAFLIAMPFLGGAKSQAGQVRLVDAFLTMRDELTRLAVQKSAAFWQQKRAEGKVARLALTDALKELVDYAASQGSANAHRYYGNITRMEYAALFFLKQAGGENFRDTLTAIQNSHLTTAESIAQRAIREGIAQGLHYKAIYQLAKDRVGQFAEMVGKSLPGEGAAGSLTLIGGGTA